MKPICWKKGYDESDKFDGDPIWWPRLENIIA